MKIDKQLNHIIMFVPSERILEYPTIFLWSKNLDKWLKFEMLDTTDRVYRNSEFKWNLYFYANRNVYHSINLPEEDDTQIRLTK